MAWPVFLAELSAGLAIRTGFHGRGVSLALVPVMTVAMSSQLASGWLCANAGGWGSPCS